MHSLSILRGLTPCPQYATRMVPPLYLDIEAESFHAGSVLLYRGLAFILRFVATGEQHTFVSFGFLILADTAWLE